MKTFAFGGRRSGFSLVELLCVMAIIALLAALLLPALTQASARARRVQCLHQLRETGLAFHAFAHDHNSQFPMAVPMNAGGSLEFAVGVERTGGEFTFSFRHFQVLSNDLVSPRLLACPSDSRSPARMFVALKNENVSYFVGLNAQYARPNTILAGDRNLTNDWTGSASLLHLARNYALRWTGGLHEFKGNLLFADGRVEEVNTPGLAGVVARLDGPVDLLMPTLHSAGGTIPVAGPSPGLTGSRSAAIATSAVPNAGGPPHATDRAQSTAIIASGGLNHRHDVVALEPGLSSVQPPTSTQGRSTNAAAAGNPGTVLNETDPGFSLFPPWVATITQSLISKTAWALYTLLALLLAVLLLLRRRLCAKKSAQPQDEEWHRD